MPQANPALHLDWDDLRLFLHIARSGTLTAAAHSLRLSQPTAGRRLRALEARIGSALFQRTSEGFRLTDEGEATLAHAEQMEEAVAAVERKLLGGARGIEGVLKLSCSDWIATRLLAAPLSRFTIAHPGVTVELIADFRLIDLARREADVALRFMPFTGNAIMQRRLTHVSYGLYAAPAYLERHGAPGQGDGAGHALVIMDSGLDQLADVQWLRRRWPAARAALRSNAREAQGIACAQGAGLAVLPSAIGDGLDLVRLPGDPPGRDIWLGYHQDMKRLRRLRLLVEHLAQQIPPRI